MFSTIQGASSLAIRFVDDRHQHAVEVAKVAESAKEDLHREDCKVKLRDRPERRSLLCLPVSPRPPPTIHKDTYVVRLSRKTLPHHLPTHKRGTLHCGQGHSSAPAFRPDHFESGDGLHICTDMMGLHCLSRTYNRGRLCLGQRAPQPSRPGGAQRGNC